MIVTETLHVCNVLSAYNATHYMKSWRHNNLSKSAITDYHILWIPSHSKNAINNIAHSAGKPALSLATLGKINSYRAGRSHVYFQKGLTRLLGRTDVGIQRHTFCQDIPKSTRHTTIQEPNPHQPNLLAD